MSSITCPNCEHETSENVSICEMCGYALKRHESRKLTWVDDDEEMSLPRWGTARFHSMFKLVLTVDTDEQTEFEISLAEKTEWIVGRCYEDHCPDIDLGEDSMMQGVSRRHFALRLYNNANIIIVDLNSTNRTRLNGQILIPEQPRILRSGDEIRAGLLRLKVDFRS